MKQQKYMPLEIEDSIEKIRIALNGNNEKVALEIVQTILGEEFRMPKIEDKLPLTNKNNNKFSPLSSNEVRVGLNVLLVQNAKTSEETSNHSFLNEKKKEKQLSGIKGLMGRIISVDYISQRALVEFYNSENGILEGWWLAFSSLIASENQIGESNENATTLRKRLSEKKEELSKIYSRQSILNLLMNTSLSLEENSPFNFRKMLSILAQENLDCHTFNSNYILSSMFASQEKLAHLYHSLPNQQAQSNFSILLLNESVSLFKKSSQFIYEKSILVKSDTSQMDQAKKVEIAGSKTLLVSFHKDSFIASQQNAKILFYRDQDCQDCIKSFESSGKNMLPFVIDQDHFFVKISQSQKTNSKYSFSVTPSHPNLSLAIWITHYLLTENLLPENSNFSLLFNNILKTCYSMKYLSRKT